MTSKYRMAAMATDARNSTRKKSKRAPSRAAINTALDHWRRSFSGLAKPRPPNESAARVGNTEAADEANQQNEHPKDSTTAAPAKRLIVGFAVWGIIPTAFADWLIRRLHLEAT